MRNDSSDIPTSIIVLNNTLTKICNSCTGWKSRLSNTTCNAMNTIFMMNVIMPKLNGNRRLSTYGTLEICDVPISPLVISAMAKELIITPQAKQTKRLPI